MSELIDHAARRRFREEWGANFAVSANAGSGKTTAISERLAAMALSENGAQLLRHTAVVTYTRKAAAQIERRARQVLLQRLTAESRRDLTALDHLERAFFGTIHSFCLKLAQTYGQTVGINLNPAIVTDNDEALWEEFIEQDAMQFHVLREPALAAFLRHLPLETIFALARELDAGTAERLRARAPAGPLPAPAAAAVEQLLALPAKGSGAKNILASQQLARAWQDAWAAQADFLPLYEPAGAAKAVVELARDWMQPLKRWLADAGAALAGELAERYRAWRFTRGVQTYADQIDAAMAVLHDETLLERMRAEGWRIILDEAQDTDPQQFDVLIEIARAPGAVRGAWPGRAGSGPRAGHFCMVGDGQQAIYGSRADIGNFSRHLEAFARGDGGELLKFQVTFRAPRAVVEVLNATLPAAFGPGREVNLGVPPAEGAPAPQLQVPYVPLELGPGNEAGWVERLALEAPAVAPKGVEAWLAEEARQVAAWLKVHGPAAVGATIWGDVAVLAPRNEWLSTARKAFEGEGLKVALQTRRNRAGDHPVYAWLTGLLAVCADPENTFEWVGVLREIFGVSDALIASELRQQGRLAWEEPSAHAAPLAAALQAVRPFVMRVNDEGQALGSFARELAAAGRLAEKARALDASGALADELDRLLAQAAELGLEGAGPRAWLGELLAHLDDGRPAGKPVDDAINLLTSHSAKGLEWPVVIVLGLWRGIGKPPEGGFKLVRAPDGPQVFFDLASLPADTREARDRERVRELTRLLYVTLTRARRSLVLPWGVDFGGRQREHPSFAELWAAPLMEIEALDGRPLVGGEGAKAEQRPTVAQEYYQPTPLPAGFALPARLLPHQLAHAPDLARTARHESGLDQPLPLANAEEAISYGLWWHETMEFVPWAGDAAALAAHGERRLQAAEALGFRERATREWAQLLLSDAWRELSAPRWTRLAELGVFAPLRADAWVDGIMDLVLHDPVGQAVWVVDWKTNRRRVGEGDVELLARLVAEYAPQLQTYGNCLEPFFPGCAVRQLVFSTAAGVWAEVPRG